MALLSSWIRGLETSYPDPNLWKGETNLAKRDVFRFTRLWLCEGIPYAFRNNGAAYELARENFAKALGDEHPKNISMTGSGRLGYSLAGSKFGTAYSHTSSDIDLFLISEAWFKNLHGDATLFISRFSAGLASPKTNSEKKYWPSNVEMLRKNMARGFINQHYIPNYDRYKSAQSCYRACNAFQETIGGQEGLAKPRKVSVRVYKNWNCAESQIGGSLLSALEDSGHIVK